MREIPRAAVIATHNRPVELRRCVEAIASQVDQIIVIDNASDPPVWDNEQDGIKWLELVDPRECVMTVMRDPEQPPNLSRLWNQGIDRVAEGWRAFCHAVGREPCWDVAVLNDDAIPPPGWFDAMSDALRSPDHQWHNPPVAASSAPFDDLAPGQHRHIGPEASPSVTTRLAGWAMVLRGEWEGARFDEGMRWWASDDDLSMRARRAGGLVHVGGFPVPNTGADTSTTGALAEQAALDMQTFVDKWGCRPW